MTKPQPNPTDLTLEQLAELLEAEAAALRREAKSLGAQAMSLEQTRKQFIADISAPIGQLRRAAGLPPRDVGASRASAE